VGRVVVRYLLLLPTTFNPFLAVSLEDLQSPQSHRMSFPVNILTEAFLYFQLPVLLGLLLHLGSQFREPTSLEIIIPLFSLNLLQTLVFHLSLQHGLLTSIFLSARCTSIFLASCWSSILIYRLGFHRLDRFRGPRWLVASKWFLIPTDLRGQVSKLSS